MQSKTMPKHTHLWPLVEITKHHVFVAAAGVCCRVELDAVRLSFARHLLMHLWLVHGMPSCTAAWTLLLRHCKLIRVTRYVCCYLYPCSYKVGPYLLPGGVGHPRKGVCRSWNICSCQQWKFQPALLVV